MSQQGGKGGLLDALATDELYLRLLRLKQKYAQAEQELGPNSTSTRLVGRGDRGAFDHHLAPFAFNSIDRGTGSEDDTKSNNAKRQQQQRAGGRATRMRSRSDSACMFINGIQLQALMRKVISQIGSCHVDTILEYLRRHWDLVRGGDLIPYNLGECRKHVMQRLRTDTALFAKDTENEGCWTLSRDEAAESSEIKYYEPQIDCIMRAMDESESGQYSLDYISAYVIKNWARRHPLSDAEIKDSVKLTLMTNPRFHYDTAVPGGIVYLRSKLPGWVQNNDKNDKNEGDNGNHKKQRKVDEDEVATAVTMMATAAAMMTSSSTPPLPSSDASSSSPSSSSVSTFIFNSEGSPVKQQPIASGETGASVESVDNNQTNGKVTPTAASTNTNNGNNHPSTTVNGGGGNNRSSVKRQRMMTPPAGYACACGATSPGKGPACKWRKGPEGQFLCNSCGLQSTKNSSGGGRIVRPTKRSGGGEAAKKEKRSESDRVSVKRRRRRGTSTTTTTKRGEDAEEEEGGGTKDEGRSSSAGGEGDEDEDEVDVDQEEEVEDDEDDEEDDSDEESSPWICCDNCGRWLLAKDDNINDVSIYDDSNPNHLDYFCPRCRDQTPSSSSTTTTSTSESSSSFSSSTSTTTTLSTKVEEGSSSSSGEKEHTESKSNGGGGGGGGNGGGEEERWSFGEDNEQGEESGMTSSETTPHLGAPNGAARKRGRTASLYAEVGAAKRKARPRTRSQQTSSSHSSSSSSGQGPISADIMGETVTSLGAGAAGKLDLAEHKIRLEWERTVSHQEGEEVDPEVSELEERFWNDVQTYKSLLTQTRDSLWSKNLVDYKKKKEKLKREMEKLDAKAESDLTKQFLEYFRRKKRKLLDDREILISQRHPQQQRRQHNNSSSSTSSS